MITGSVTEFVIAPRRVLPFLQLLAPDHYPFSCLWLIERCQFPVADRAAIGLEQSEGAFVPFRVAGHCRVGDDSGSVVPASPCQDLAVREALRAQAGLRATVVVETEGLPQEALADHSCKHTIDAEMRPHLLCWPPKIRVWNADLAHHSALVRAEVNRLRDLCQVPFIQLRVVRREVGACHVGGM
jgi:hypothetical protein